MARYMKKNLEMTKPVHSEHILSVPWPFVISTSTVLPSNNVLTVLNLNTFLSKMQEELVMLRVCSTFDL